MRRKKTIRLGFYNMKITVTHQIEISLNKKVQGQAEISGMKFKINL